jgi:hypothetical protein
MANTTLTADIVAKAALPILENELGWVNQLYRSPEEEFNKNVNGYKIGDTLSVRRPADFTVRSGATLSTQDVIEGKTTITIDQQIGVDFQFSSTDLTLKVEDMATRIIKPAMSSIVNYMANDLATQMYTGFYNWVGTAGETVNSYADFAKGPERLDELATPMDGRLALLSPADHWGLLGSQTALYNGSLVSSAYTKGSLGEIGGVATYMSQVVPSHTTGSRDNSTPLTDGIDQNVTYDTAKNTWTQSLVTDGWDSSATITAGDVFTIDGVYMVNPKTKASTGILQQFVVTAAVTADETITNDTTLTISPPIIISGPHQTVTYSGTTDGRTITNVGTASTAYKQNMVFHKNAMALAVVPMEMPAAAYGAARESYKGLSVRVIPIYDGTNDISKWRLDLLYGRKLIDPRVGTRLSGTG